MLWIDVRRSEAPAETVVRQLVSSGIPSGGSEAVKLEALLEASASAGRKTLIVFDNVDYLEGPLEQLVDSLAAAPRCWVVLTTREPHVARSLRADSIEIGGFELSDAVACLKIRLELDPRRFDEPGLADVARHVGQVPLWVQLAAGHLRRYRTPLADYIKGGGPFEQILGKLSDDELYAFVACGVCSATDFSHDSVHAVLYDDSPGNQLGAVGRDSLQRSWHSAV